MRSENRVSEMSRPDAAMKIYAMGTVVSPSGIPASAMATMPIRIAPPTFRDIRMAITISPSAASRTCGSEDFPSVTNVAVLATIIFAFRSPTNAMKKPMPAAVPCFRRIGNIVNNMLANIGQR